MSEKNLEPAIAVQDEDDHWYVIPKHLKAKWDSINYKLEHTVSYSYEWHALNGDFLETFSKYKTGGCLNNTQLYAEFESNSDEP